MVAGASQANWFWAGEDAHAAAHGLIADPGPLGKFRSSIDDDLVRVLEPVCWFHVLVCSTIPFRSPSRAG